ncbi:hypothetical protein JW992_03895, partial [candidate division KSB1 bacterium]|nr:hypothetical protein [candidate division KSB1 bacterium]
MKTRQWILSLALGLTLILPLFAHAAATDAGGMLQFDSDALQQDRVTVPYNAAQDLSANFTLEFWVKAADFSNEPRLLQRKDAFALFLTTSGNVKFESKNGTMVAVTSSATLSLNSWHHIAVTVEDLGGGNFQAQIYIDGVLDASNTDALFQIPWAAEPLMIGNQQNGSGPLEGWMDDVRIWSEVRSTAQIADNRGKALEGTEANLVSYYNFDETGQTVNDLTGTQDGVLGTDATVEDSDPTRVAISTAPIGIRLLSPNGGESYPIGTAFTVTWACDPAVPQVDVLLSMDGGVNWLFLAKATNNDGSLQAYAPGPPTTQAVIMLLNTTDPNQNDAGDGFFSTTEVPNWQVNIYKEAEDGVLTKPMMRAIDGLSFNCYQIYSYKNNVGTAVLQVNLPISGIYVIWGRTYSEGGTRNSFYISVDGGPEALYDIKKNSSWNWAPVSERGNALAGTTPEIAPVLYYLTAGTHEITIRGRENYARFDRLAITNNLQQDFYWLNPDRWILLTAPEDKAQVERGKPVEITWESYNISSVVTIDASFDHLNSFPLLIAQSTPNDGAFIWNVPANLNYEIAYIRITSGSSAGSCPMDANYQQFYLVDPKPELNVLQPNGGEKWVAGSTEQISWASEFYSGTVNIDFSTDNGATWTQIAAAQPAGGTLDWTIPNTPSTTCWVRAYNSGGGAPSDTSDAAFEIVAPPQPDETLTVIAPNGGENLTGGNSFAIQWEAENLSDPVNIDVSIDNGTTWSTIATGQSPTGSYAWTVPTLNVDNAWVRVYEPTDSVPADTSDASFSIVTGGPLSESITVVYPNGGETLQIGSTIDIQWQSENFSGTVDVAVSLDNGATWSTIATAQPAIGSVAWSVPDISTQLGWVKVFDTADEDPIDLSDAPFAIAPALPMPTNYGLSF